MSLKEKNNRRYQLNSPSNQPNKSSACVLIQKACIEWYDTLLNTKVSTKHASPLCESLGRVRADDTTQTHLDFYKLADLQCDGQKRPR